MVNKLDVYQNQSSIINIEDYDYLRIAIIGLGSIGSFLAVALNKLGFKNLIIIDDDIIEHHNPTTQLYFQKDISKPKADTLKRCYLKGNINAYNQRVTPLNKLEADIVFICVDSLKQRKLISKAILESHSQFHVPKLIIDGRMHRLIFRVFTIPLENQPLLNTYVKSTMQKEFIGPCTEKGIIQNVFAIVSIMVEQLKKVINGEDYYATINCDFERLTFINTGLQSGQKKDPPINPSTDSPNNLPTSSKPPRKKPSSKKTSSKKTPSKKTPSKKPQPKKTPPKKTPNKSTKTSTKKPNTPKTSKNLPENKK